MRCIAISNGHMHDYAFFIYAYCFLHLQGHNLQGHNIVFCICRDIICVCAFANLVAFRVGLTRSICINFLLS